MPAFQPRFIAARDGTRLRTGVFEAAEATRGAARSVCVLLHGQTEFIEKYDEVIGELNARGFTVATFDWRGQGGSARGLDNPLPAHVRDFAEYDDDLRSFLDHIVRPLTDAPPLALAHSMGAHILLRTLHDRPQAFRAAVLSAPMIAVSARGYPAWLARAVTAGYNALGRGRDFAWGMAARDPFLITFDTQLVTSDRERFARAQKSLSDHPDLRLAGPTWGWLEAAYRSMAKVRAPGFAEAIPMPVLVAGAGRDRICVTAAAQDFTGRLPRGTWLALEDSEHEILMENDSIRSRFWVAFDEFAT
ncbi:MAG TPA: alpha/beta hydrolase [Rhizomicrobium sp.]|nr:alpha/beta hydrolase [Rhizomicrobium sp.]